MTTALVRKCDICHSEIPDGRAFVLSRFDLQRASGAPVVVEPQDICGAECFYVLMRGLFDAAMSSAFAAADAGSPLPAGAIVRPTSARRAS